MEAEMLKSLTLLCIPALLCVMAVSAQAQGSGWCDGNLLSNGNFSTGLAPWNKGMHTVDYNPAPGCGGDAGFINMWGNMAQGEWIWQTRPSGGELKAGKTYEISFCQRFSPQAGRPYPVRFRIVATNDGTAPYTATTIALSDLTSSSTWTTATAVFQCPPGPDLSIIMVHAENESSATGAGTGDSTSTGQLDMVCIREVGPCDYVNVTARNDNDRPCCKLISLSNSLPDVWDHITVNVLNGNGLIQEVIKSSSWQHDVSTFPVTSLNLSPVTGAIPTCNDESFFRLCFDDTAPFASMVEFVWVGTGNQECRDTIFLTCGNYCEGTITAVPAPPGSNCNCLFELQTAGWTAVDRIDVFAEYGGPVFEVPCYDRDLGTPVSTWTDIHETEYNSIIRAGSGTGLLPFEEGKYRFAITESRLIHWRTYKDNQLVCEGTDSLYCESCSCDSYMESTSVPVLQPPIDPGSCCFTLNTLNPGPINEIVISVTNTGTNGAVINHIQGPSPFPTWSGSPGAMIRLLSGPADFPSCTWADFLYCISVPTGSADVDIHWETRYGGQVVCQGDTTIHCGVTSSFCPDNLLQNGNFEFATNGEMPSPGSANAWQVTYGTPDVRVAPDGCDGDENYIGMWGNKNHGEAMHQSITFTKDTWYKIQFCGRREDVSNLHTDRIRFKLRAADAAPSSPSGGLEIYSTPYYFDTQWHTSSVLWQAPDDYSMIVVSAEYDSYFPGNDSTSYGSVDNFCITEWEPCGNPECETNTLSLNTGEGSVPGDMEPHWELVAVPDNAWSQTVPRDPYVIDNHQAWYPYQNTSAAQWISANQHADWGTNNPDQPYEFTYCLCVCRDDTVTLDMKYWVDNSAVVYLNNTVISSTPLDVTDNFQDGTAFTYTFPVVKDGDYCIRIEMKNQSGVAMGLMVEGTLTGSDPDNPTFLSYDCCHPGSSISGRKILDVDGDGTETPTIANGIAGWTITLEGPDGTVTAVTDAMGYYYFPNLRPGNYTVTETQQTDFTPTNPASGTYTVSLGENESLQLDFLNHYTGSYGSICGIKFHDLNKDGVKDEDEETIQSWVITGTGGLYNVTDESGWFCWNLLPPGTYTICEQEVDGWTATTPTCVTVELEANENEYIEFGNYFGGGGEICDSIDATGALIDGECCKYRVSITNSSTYPVDAISYQVVGGTIDMVNAQPCPYTAQTFGPSAGGMSFAGGCYGNMTFDIGVTAASNPGQVQLILTLSVGGERCTHTFEFTCEKGITDPCICCDIVETDPFDFTGLDLSGMQFQVHNLKDPPSPITHIDIHPDPTITGCILQGGGLEVDAIPQSWGLDYYRAPLSGSFPTPTAGTNTLITFNLGVDFTCGWNGSITLVILHADGDSCVFTHNPWKTTRPVVSNAVTQEPYDGDIYSNMLRATSASDSTHRILIWPELAEDKILAGSGQHLGGGDADRNAEILADYRQADNMCLFEFQKPLKAGVPSGYFNITVKSAVEGRKPRLYWTSFDEQGIALETGFVILEKTSGIPPMGGTPLPGDFQLLPYFPDPATDNAMINFQLGQRMHVQLDIYTLLGEYVTTVFRGDREAGLQSVRFNTSRLASGNYYLRMSSGDRQTTQQLRIAH
jgi:hypothetical protein